ncbi:formimidoylglutamase [Oceanobacillus sp. CAU 1775]
MKKENYLKQSGQAIFKDRYTTRANELLVDSEVGASGKFGLIGLPLSKSSISHSGASFAPSAIRSSLASFTTYSGEMGLDLTESILDFGDVLMHPTDIVESQRRITAEVAHVMEKSFVENWMFLGGDHGVTYSTIKAASNEKKIGIIQFDAHHDLRNTEDGGPTNGTPFRRLLEDKIIKGEHITQIGIRDFMNAKDYDNYSKEQGIIIYTMNDVEDKGILNIMKAEVERLSDLVDSIYLSVDMDVLDQAFAPGCPAIGPGGMDSNSLIKSIAYAAQHNKVKMMDIVEIDPTLDFRNMTSRVAAYLMLQFMKGKIEHKE